VNHANHTLPATAHDIRPTVTTSQANPPPQFPKGIAHLKVRPPPLVIKVSQHARRAYGLRVQRFGEYLDGKNFATATKAEIRAWLSTVYELKLEKATMA
jgi:hypothetical protein